jgi:hypothetical protein
VTGERNVAGIYLLTAPLYILVSLYQTVLACLVSEPMFWQISAVSCTGLVRCSALMFLAHGVTFTIINAVYIICSCLFVHPDVFYLHLSPVCFTSLLIYVYQVYAFLSSFLLN